MRTISSEPPTTPLIDRDRWKLMTFVELTDQRNIMMDRYYALIEMKKPELAKAILAGAEELETIIMTKL